MGMGTESDGESQRCHCTGNTCSYYANSQKTSPYPGPATSPSLSPATSPPPSPSLSSYSPPASSPSPASQQLAKSSVWKKVLSKFTTQSVQKQQQQQQVELLAKLVRGGCCGCNIQQNAQSAATPDPVDPLLVAPSDDYGRDLAAANFD